MEIVRFHPPAASREDWGRYHAYRRLRHQESDPEDPVVPDSQIEIGMMWSDPFNENIYFEAVEAGEVVGAAEAWAPLPTSPEYPSGRHILWVGGGVLHDHRRRGVGRALLEPLAEHMRERGMTVMTLWSHEVEKARGFMRWLGAEERFRGGENRLVLAAVDWAMVEAWVREGEANTGGTRLELYEPRLPDSMLDEFCPAYTEMLNTTTFEDLDHGEEIYTPEMMRDQYALSKRLGDIRHIALTREPDGTISGMTEVIQRPYLPDRVHQELTAVHTRYQGRGLGKWLKAAMLLLVRETYPEVRLVVTENAGSNAPMLAINRRLGFRQHRSHAGYQVSLETLLGRLAQASSAQ